MPRIGAIILGLITAVVTSSFVTSTIYKHRLQRLQGQSSVISELRDSIRYYVVQEGRLVAEKSAAEASLALLKEVYAGEFEEIKNKLDINAKDVRGIYKAVTTTSGSGEGGVTTIYVPVPTGDTVQALSVYDSTKWFTISGVVSKDKFKYEYTVYDNITLVPYRDGRRLLVRGTNSNPNTRLTGLTGILVAEDKPKPWGIGPSIQLGYDTEFRITPGISLQYSLIRF